MPVKVNLEKQLFTTLLDIADVNNLQNELDLKVGADQSLNTFNSVAFAGVETTSLKVGTAPSDYTMPASRAGVAGQVPTSDGVGGVTWQVSGSSSDPTFNSVSTGSISVGANPTDYVLPAARATTVGHVLTADAAGATSWQAGGDPLPTDPTFNTITVTDLTTPFGQNLEATADVGFNSITTVQTVFAADQEVVSKKFVDDAIAGIAVNNYIQLQQYAGVPDPIPATLEWDSGVYAYTSITFPSVDVASFNSSVLARQAITSYGIVPNDIAVGGFVQMDISCPSAGQSGINKIALIQFKTGTTEYENPGGTGITIGNQIGNCSYVSNGLTRIEQVAGTFTGPQFNNQADYLFKLILQRTGASVWEFRVDVSTNGGAFSTLSPTLPIAAGRESEEMFFGVADWVTGSPSSMTVTITGFSHSLYTPSTSTSPPVPPLGRSNIYMDSNSNLIYQTSTGEVQLN